MSVLSATPLQCAPSAAAGVTVTIGLQPAWGAWVEILTVTAAPIAVAGIQVDGGTYGNRTYDLDVGVGAAGVEASVGTIRLHCETNTATVSGPDGLILPVCLGGIGSGVRVAVRARSSLASSGPTSITLLYYENFSGDQVTTSAHVLAAAPAALAATLTPNATAWANSAWVTLLASAATDIGLLGIVHGSTNFTNDGCEYDLGTGTAGAETVVTTLRDAPYGTGALRFPQTWLPGMYPVAAGTRIAIRLRKAGTATTGTLVSLLYYTNISTADAAVSGVVTTGAVGALRVGSSPTVSGVGSLGAVGALRVSQTVAASGVVSTGAVGDVRFLGLALRRWITWRVGSRSGGFRSDNNQE